MSTARSAGFRPRALAALVAVLLLSQVTSPPRSRPALAPTKPSVLLLFLHGAGVRLGCYGGPSTPNLDRLARDGRLFDRAYAQYPQSEASRVSLMVGRRPEISEVWGPPELAALQETMPLQERFRAAGYRAIRVGPVYGGEAEGAARWDVAAEPGPNEDAGQRVAALLGANQNERFFLVATLGDLPQEIPPPAAVPGGPKLPEIPAIAVSRGRVDRPGRVVRPAALTSEVRGALQATLDARVDRIDAQVGTILSTLDRLGLRQRIIVAVVADGGAPLGAHGDIPRGDLLFDETLRTALIVTAPDLADPGVRTRSLVELVDVYPTLLDLCGLPRPRGVDGVSLASVVRDSWAGVHTAAFSVVEREAGYLGRSVRTRRYRYTEWPDGSAELYDHDADPKEWTNLARNPTSGPALVEMRKLLDEHEAQSPLAPPLPAPQRAPRHPNVLLILLDDLTVRLGSYGYDVKTPNIDRLASRGRRFARAYCQAPMCSPSRTSLMTGWRPERIDLWTNALAPRSKVAGAVPLQELFHANGYFTARVGKIYHGPFEDEFRWDLAESVPVSRGGAALGDADEADTDRGDGGASSSWWLATDKADGDEPDGMRARRVAQLLGEKRGRPFFIGLGFAKPHLRWRAPRKYFDLYPPDTIALDPVLSDDLADVPLIALTHNRPIPAPGLTAEGLGLRLDPATGRQALAGYYACVSFVDAQVGVVLDALERHKLWDDTIVLLLSDHGYHLGEHDLWRKDTLFEAALQAPLIVAAPQVRPPGVASDEVAELLDVYPTVVELAGLARPAGIDGRSLVPVLEDPDARGRGAAFSFRSCTPPRLGRSLRTDRYRFTEWPDGSRELYDAARDPDELANLASDPGHASVVRDLKQRLDAGPAAARRATR